MRKRSGCPFLLFSFLIIYSGFGWSAQQGAPTLNVFWCIVGKFPSQYSLVLLESPAPGPYHQCWEPMNILDQLGWQRMNILHYGTTFSMLTWFINVSNHAGQKNPFEGFYGQKSGQINPRCRLVAKLTLLVARKTFLGSLAVGVNLAGAHGGQKSPSCWPEKPPVV